MQEIFERRSIRHYQDQKVAPEIIERLAEAGFRAPSAHNQQVWEVLVIEDRDTLNQLTTASPYYGPLTRCPVALVLLADQSKMTAEPYWQQDMGAMAQNILLEIVSQGLGGVWLGLAPDQERVAEVSRQLNLPQHIWPFAIIALGYPDTEQPVRKRNYTGKLHFETYSQEG